jgi:hypothetical protein
MFFSAIRRLGFLATLGLGLWLISKIAAERADRRHLSRSTAPWPAVPVDGQEPEAKADPKVGPIVAHANDDEVEPDPIGRAPQTVALSGSGRVMSHQLPHLEAPDPSAWVEPDGGSCPLDHPVKAKLTSHIYHEPGMAAYRRTNADRCYTDGAGAENDGFVRAKR